jgi:hypothetical protein
MPTRPFVRRNVPVILLAALALTLAFALPWPDIAAVHAAPQNQRPGRAGDPARDPTLPTSSIRGRVLIAGTTTPVRGAEVRARASDGRENRLVTSDSDGSYEVRDLLAGKWLVTVSKAGFVSQQYGQRRPLEAVKPIELRAGQRVTANLELTRGGVISGRIYDEFGDPVAGARVQVLRQRLSAQGRRELTPTGAADQTDDTGAFRVFALPPGNYYVTAVLRTGAVDTSPIESPATAPTYYPGTTTLAGAQRISVGPGEEQVNINFPVPPVRVVRVSGTLLTSTGAPPSGAQVSLRSTVDSGPMTYAVGNFGVVRQGGAFTIVNVPPGSYTLMAQAQIRTAPGVPSAPQRESAFLPLTVGGEDVTGLTVITTKGATVNVLVAVDTGTVLPPGAGLQLTAQSMRGMRMMNGSRPGIRTFTLSGLEPDQWLFGVDGLPEGWAIKTIEANGLDVTDTLLDLSGGETTALRIVVTDRTTDLSGVVTMRGQPAANMPVVIFPDDPSRWTIQSRYVRSVRTDDQGRYRIRGLPPDPRYLAVALDYLEDGQYQDPELLDQLRRIAVAVPLREAEKRSLDLRLTAR